MSAATQKRIDQDAERLRAILREHPKVRAEV